MFSRSRRRTYGHVGMGWTSRSSSKLVNEDEVIRVLRLDDRRSKNAQRRAVDGLWQLAQRVRKRHKEQPLRRVKVGLRYRYSPDVVAQFVDALDESARNVWSTFSDI